MGFGSDLRTSIQEGQMQIRTLRAAGAVLWASTAAAQAPKPTPAPIIDVHLHAMPVAAFGPPPAIVCAQQLTYSGYDPRDSIIPDRLTVCASAHRIVAPATDEAMLQRTLAILRRYNIAAMTSGPMDFVRKWKAAAPNSIIASAGA